MTAAISHPPGLSRAEIVIASAKIAESVRSRRAATARQINAAPADIEESRPLLSVRHRTVHVDERLHRVSGTVPSLQDKNPGVPLNCPWCGTPLTYIGSAEDADDGDAFNVHVYECATDGRMYLTRWELTRRKPRGWSSR